ncbi:Zn-ribbon domain-containing OB-fold protein [Ferrovibrio sp.]|uniref:Zn-ribbon domain-containing OB-fold protein n=1 Tax=Ferrovibrio sp. TaxID=1917215 RepID=UPI0039C87D8D
MIQRSRTTGQYVFYPRVAAPGSGVADLEWVAASGLGRIYSITVNRARTGSYNIALVELDEGPRLMTRIEGVETAPIGTRVKARIAEVNGELTVVFDVVER